MKFKALAAAVALLSTASVAQAEWHDGKDDALLTGDGELLLVAFDDVRKVSVVQDLGGSYVELWDNRANGSFQQSFNLDPLFASTFAGSNASDIQWSVFANNYGYAEGGYNEPAAFSNGFMVTSNSSNPTIDRTIGNDFSLQDKVNVALYEYVNSQLGKDGNYAANGAFYGDASNNLYAGSQAYYGTDILGSVTFNTTGLAGETLNFWTLLTSQASNGEYAGKDVLVGYWNLDLNGGIANYVATPVPAAVWLLASGLLGLGAISRRRKA